MQIKVYCSEESNVMKKMLTGKNIGNMLFVVLLLVLLFVPSAKAAVLRGLMQMGFFSPDVESNVQEKEPMTIDLSALHFKDAAGNGIVLGDLKGKVVFLNFWATWCPPCLAEMPSMNKMYNKFKDDQAFVFIFVDADSDLLKSAKFMEKRNYHLPLYRAASAIPEMIFSGSLPTTVVFDKQGRISYHESGATNYNDNRFIDFMTKLKNMK